MSSTKVLLLIMHLFKAYAHSFIYSENMRKDGLAAFQLRAEIFLPLRVIMSVKHPSVSWLCITVLGPKLCKVPVVLRKIPQRTT